MKRLVVVLGMALAMGAQTMAFAQAKVDFTGTWRFNQAKSSPNIAGNTPVIPFPSQIVVKQTANAVVRLKDVARVELAALDYSSNSYLDVDPAVALAVFQRPGSNALATSGQIKATMERLKKSFPTGLDYSVVYNPTEFIQASVDAVIETLFEALLLVVIFSATILSN